MATIDHQFEPMTLGMVLDRAFRLYSQNFSLMFGITAILHLPIFLLSILSVALAFSGSHPLLEILAVFSMGLVGLLTLLFVYPLATGATTKAVSDKYLGNPVTIASALKEALSNVGTLLLTQFVVGLLVLVGFMLLIVPGVLWMLSYALVPSVIMIEASDRKISRPVYSITGATKTAAPPITDRTDIRRRSWQLVKGNRGKVFVVLLVFYIMSILLSGGTQWIARMFLDATSTGGATLRSIIGNVVAILVSPLQTIAITLLYYDFRIRKEGFDLEMLSQAMGTPAVKV